MAQLTPQSAFGTADVIAGSSVDSAMMGEDPKGRPERLVSKTTRSPREAQEGKWQKLRWKPNHRQAYDVSNPRMAERMPAQPRTKLNLRGARNRMMGLFLRNGGATPVSPTRCSRVGLASIFRSWKDAFISGRASAGGRKRCLNQQEAMLAQEIGYTPQSRQCFEGCS